MTTKSEENRRLAAGATDPERAAVTALDQTPANGRLPSLPQALVFASSTHCWFFYSFSLLVWFLVN